MKISAAEEVFETWRRRVGYVVAPIAFFLTFYFATGLTPEGRRLAGILAAVGVLWITETLPLPVTALFGAVLCIAFGVAPAKQVLAYFADPIVFVFIGSFMLARAMSIHKLDRRIAMMFLANPLIGGRPAFMLGGMGIITAAISMWVSNTATTAMMLPIGLGILGAMHRGEGPIDTRRWPFATGMMLMIAYAASIGGIGTPVGSPPNLIAIGHLKKTAGVDISFGQWMLVTVPLLMVMGAVLLVLLYWLHPHAAGSPASRDSESRAMAHYIKDERLKLGPWSVGEINTLIAFGLAMVLWILPGVFSVEYLGPTLNAAAKWMSSRFPEATVGLLAAILLFILPVSIRNGEFTLRWEDAVKIDWGTILLFGGGLALGTLMFETKVAEALGKSVTSHLGVDSLWMLTGVAIAMGIILSEATSNTAAANMIIPVVIGVCQSLHVSPVPPVLGACLGASYGFMLPVSTPPNAIVYGSGMVTIPAMMRAGILFDIIGFLIIWGGLRMLCPLIGLT